MLDLKKRWKQQRERARTARQDVDSMQVQSGVLGDIKVESTFVGYDQLQIQANVIVSIKRWTISR